MPSPCLLVSWEAAGVALGERLGVMFVNNPTITSLNYRQTRIPLIVAFECDALTSITAPNLVTIEGNEGGYLYQFNAVEIVDCNVLTTLNLSSVTTMTTAFTIVDNPLLTTVDFSSLVTINYDLTGPSGTNKGFIWVENNAALTSLSFPALTTLNQGAIASEAYIRNCAALTTISFPNLTIPNDLWLDFTNNALSQASVDHVLARLVANPAYVTGQVQLQGGTNSAPSVAGLADKATLAGRGVTVTTN